MKGTVSGPPGDAIEFIRGFAPEEEPPCECYNSLFAIVMQY